MMTPFALYTPIIYIGASPFMEHFKRLKFAYLQYVNQKASCRKNSILGTRNKEMMAIGGAWSPSLDGCNPESDPQVFVRTAIRTVRALIGVDLSKCPRWYVRGFLMLIMMTFFSVFMSHKRNLIRWISSIL